MDNFFVNFSLIGLFLILLVPTIVLVCMLRGAPYVPSQEKTVQKMVSFANIKPGERAIDLGSGDGRIIIALAKAGAEAHGYEINPALVWLARKKIKKEGLEKNAFIHLKDFWSVDFSDFDVVTVFGITHIMGFLKRKCKKELGTNGRVISNSFTFSKWPYSKKEGEVYLYERKNL